MATFPFQSSTIPHTPFHPCFKPSSIHDKNPLVAANGRAGQFESFVVLEKTIPTSAIRNLTSEFKCLSKIHNSPYYVPLSNQKAPQIKAHPQTSPDKTPELFPKNRFS